jgi:hypothetical protein
MLVKILHGFSRGFGSREEDELDIGCSSMTRCDADVLELPELELPTEAISLKR